MSAATTSRTRRIVSRITAIWAEMDYAQRRMFETQTGITEQARQHGRRDRLHRNEHDTRP
jgi:hypothetical protein